MGTSRGVLTTRDVFIVALRDRDRLSFGECAPLQRLSFDDRPGYESKLAEVCRQISDGVPWNELILAEWPSIRFGLETAALGLKTGTPGCLFDTPFTRGESGLPINGLVVMGTFASMKSQVSSKVAAGFDCLKIKIGAFDFETEYRFLNQLREEFPADKVRLRLDANGAFTCEDAFEKLDLLSRLSVHSVEQPIRKGNTERMAAICAESPVPIALDEELIGFSGRELKVELLQTINPHFVVLKPSLLGGLAACEEWIDIAGELGMGYWITSMLESNIGLNAISQWTSTLEPVIHQGLGTGQLFVGNFPSRLSVRSGELYHSGEPDLLSQKDLTTLRLQ